MKLSKKRTRSHRRRRCVRRRFVRLPTIVDLENEASSDAEAVTTRAHRRRCSALRAFIRLPTIVEAENEVARILQLCSLPLYMSTQY
jgi:hypothetical protein